MNKKTHHALESVCSIEAREIEDSLWWIQGRKNIIKKYLHKISSLLNGDIQMIMDIGCGSGGSLDVLAEQANVIGVEPSIILAERAKARNIARQIYELPAWEVKEINSINLFTMFDVLEHIEDDANFLKKLKKSAPQNHVLFLSVPACPFLFSDHDKLLSHYRRYSQNMLNDCLIQSGYKPLLIQYHMFLLFPMVLLVRLIEKLKSSLGFSRETVYVGTVSPFLNYIFTQILKLESALSEYIRYPIGLWLFAIAVPNKK